MTSPRPSPPRWVTKTTTKTAIPERCSAGDRATRKSCAKYSPTPEAKLAIRHDVRKAHNRNHYQASHTSQCLRQDTSQGSVVQNSWRLMTKIARAMTACINRFIRGHHDVRGRLKKQKKQSLTSPTAPLRMLRDTSGRSCFWSCRDRARAAHDEISTCHPVQLP